jgi:tRNA1Val (adenine37-N6)-methyltransferase
MKVGTDGVLLGAWVSPTPVPSRILDVGAGSGLISLMLAQRFPDSEISALEIDGPAARQAKENAARSVFADRIQVVCDDFFNYVPEADTNYDLIVSNPPFYSNAHPANTETRSIARHDYHFDWLRFLEISSEITDAQGELALILPPSLYNSLPFSSSGWHLKAQCSVKSTPHKTPHRLLLMFAKKQQKAVYTELTIENQGRHNYSEEYISLTKDFYLHM